MVIRFQYNFTLEGHPMRRDVTSENILTCAQCFHLQPARTRCVSIELAPFLPLFFAASVPIAESVYASPCGPGDVISRGWFLIKGDHV